MEEKETLITSMLPHLNAVPDPRQAGKIRYPLGEMLFLALCSIVSDCTEWGDIVDFGNDKLEWLRKYYPYENGIPSHDTLNRSISLIRPEDFSFVFRTWLKERVGLSEAELISLDGKKLRGSATKSEQQTLKAEGGKGGLIILEAWSTSLGLCLDVAEVEGKGNETKTIPSMLERLDLEGCVVSMDAAGCQRDIISTICSKRADCVISVKGNQPKLYDSIVSAFANASEDGSVYREYNKDHGRAEERRCTILSFDRVEDSKIRESWPDIKTIIQIKSWRHILSNKQDTKEVRYYISSKEGTAQAMAGYVRGHWGIENALHWALDVYWGEDYSRKQAKNAALNFGILLRIALNLVKASDVKLSIKRKLKKAARSDAYREMILRI